VADSENGLGETFEEARGPKDPVQLVKPETKTTKPHRTYEKERY